MKQLDKIRQDISELQTIADSWGESGSLSNIERDLILKKLRHLYDAVLFAETTSQLVAESSEKQTPAETVIVGTLTAQEPQAESEESDEEEPQEIRDEEQMPTAIATPTEEVEEQAEEQQEVQQEVQAEEQAEEVTVTEPEVGITPEEQTFEPEREFFEEDEEILVLDDMFFIDEQAEERFNESDNEAVEQPKAESDEYIDELTDELEIPIPEEEFEIEEEPEIKQEHIVEQKPTVEQEQEQEQEREQEVEEEPTAEEPENEVVEVVELEKQPAAPQNNQHQQSNLFDIDSYTTPRRSHRRLMSLYDEEIFEQSASVREISNEPLISEVVIEEQTPYTESESKEEEPLVIESQKEINEQATGSNTEQYIEEQVVEEVEIETDVTHAESYTISEQATPSEKIEISEIAYEEQKESNEPQPQSVINALNTEPTPVLGDVMMSDKQTLGDKIAKSAAQTTADYLSHASINTLREALGINDRYTIITELFGGNEELCDKALTMLDEQESLEDAIIFIETNFSWHPSSEAANMIMEILERKFS